MTYQEVENQRKVVPSRFVLIDDKTYAFEVPGTYDPARPLMW